LFGLIRQNYDLFFNSVVLAVAKIQALLVFCFGFAGWQKPNVLECVVGFSTLTDN